MHYKSLQILETVWFLYKVLFVNFIKLFNHFDPKPLFCTALHITTMCSKSRSTVTCIEALSFTNCRLHYAMQFFVNLSLCTTYVLEFLVQCRWITSKGVFSQKIFPPPIITHVPCHQNGVEVIMKLFLFFLKYTNMVFKELFRWVLEFDPLDHD